MKRIRILSVFGTRPEAIKMAPVVRELAKYEDRIESMICVTAQHREMLDQVLRIFRIEPDIDCDLMEKNQGLSGFAVRALAALGEILERTRPDAVLVQGDTTTAMVAGLAAFYMQIPVGHVEAGLRTHSRYLPFPEEMNRRLLGALSTFHFTPTERAAAALRQEGVSEAMIFVTGNPVIDALLWVREQLPSAEVRAFLASVGMDSEEKRTILVTAHRRENFGPPMERICFALQSIVERNPEVQIVFPVHRNPRVQHTVRGLLGETVRVHLTDPLPYDGLVHAMDRAHFLLTDSGGLQEEGPALGKPVLVLREETERPEGVEVGTARVVGTEARRIVEEVERLLHDEGAHRRMASAVSPYGDGRAAERIVGILIERLASFVETEKK